MVNESGFFETSERTEEKKRVWGVDSGLGEPTWNFYIGLGLLTKNETGEDGETKSEVL